jgi:SAM-dependent methyltransferase
MRKKLRFCVVNKTYNTLSTQFYELVKTAENADAEIAFYASYAAQASGPILEPMCGSGRVLLPLLARGYAIEGFDASAAMLAVLREKYKLINEGPAPVWQQFMQQFGNDKKYALIIIPFGSFGLILDRTEAAAALRTLREHLLPGGRLIIEIDTVHSVNGPQKVVRRASCRRDDGIIIGVRAVIAYDEATQLFTSRSCYDLQQNGVTIATEEERFEQYLYRRDEFDALAQSAGFTILAMYGNYAHLAATDEAPLVLYVLEARQS